MRKWSLKAITAICFLGLALGIGSAPFLWAQSQVPGIGPGPYNIDLGAIVTNIAQVPGTYTSAQQTSPDKSGVICTFNRTAFSGSPSNTFGIQIYDTASNTYQTVVSSAAITATPAGPISILTYPGVTLITTPTGMVAQAIPITRYWRVTETITGAGTQDTSTIGCVLLK